MKDNSSLESKFSNKTKSVSINKDFLQDNLYTSYSKLFEVKLLNVGMASPGRIRQWAEKTLPNRRVCRHKRAKRIYRSIKGTS